ncbi:MAG: ADP-ribosylglycohydrolase family protein [Limisphaerales bacterium]
MSALTNTINKDRILGGLWGSLVGDALGVPVEFMDRATVQFDPVTSMREFGTHNQLRGTWSDDGAMMLCTTDSLLNHEFNLADMGNRFLQWMTGGLWTANGDVFDVGATTSAALRSIAKGTPPDQAGGKHEDNNGNGSLMRILPVVLRFAAEPIDVFTKHIERASAITHGHLRSQMACVFYGLVVRQILLGEQPQTALSSALTEFASRYERSAEFSRFRSILEDALPSLSQRDVFSTGYVLHTLHASLWCLLTTDNYRDCVLKAVNLGGDTDTTGCVAGGLAGVVYGMKSIPADWINQLARKGDVDCLFHEFAELCESALTKK